MILKHTDYNPIPEDANAGFVETPDNVKLRYAHWHATKNPTKGTVLLLHGRTESIEKLYETVGDITARGFEVLTFDWRGQGGSDRLVSNSSIGYIDNYEQYVTDLLTVFDKIALPDCKAPYYIVSHSTGGLVALLAVPQLANKIHRMLLSAPFLGIKSSLASQNAIKILSGFLNAIGLGELPLGHNGSSLDINTFAGNRYTNDTERFERNRQLWEEFEELTIGRPSVSWVYASIRAIEKVNDVDFYTKISIPTLILAAGNDSIVSNKAIEKLASRLRTGSCLTIDGARHEIFHEHDRFREQLLVAFDSFIGEEK